MIFGIDISGWQTNVDYAKAVKEGGVRFAVLRAGYGRQLSQKDKMFEAHYAGMSGQGIPLGAYQYSYASDVAGARAEAAAMIEWLKGKAFALPVFYDLEDEAVAKAGKATITEMALVWCAALEAAGYRAGVYANRSWFSDYIDVERVAAKHEIWCAQWSKNQPTLPNLALWQFGGETNFIRSTNVAGFSGAVDQNYLVKEALLSNSPAGKQPTANKPADKEPQAAPKIEGRIDTTKEVQIWLNKNYAAGLMPDGLYGSLTKTALVKALQKELGVAVDGVYGRKTNAAVHSLSRGVKSEVVKVLQAFLVCCGYKAAYIDGDFGIGTEEAVRAFQQRFKIHVDGIAGKKTFSALCK